MADNVKPLRIIPEDIVGNTYGPYIVKEYVGTKMVKCTPSRVRTGNMDTTLVHMYLVECMKCGKTRECTRSVLFNSYVKSKNCIHCSSRINMLKVDRNRLYTEGHKKSVEARLKRNEVNRNNTSSGIKHYSISPRGSGRANGKCYIHRVEVSVDGFRYPLIVKYSETNDPLPECVKMANELNDVLVSGKDSFYKWLETILFCDITIDI